MIIAKLILGFFLVLLLVFYLAKVRSKMWDRIIFTILLISGIVFIIYPDATSKIAHLVGIGRGADLVFYLAIVFFLFCFILLYSKNREFEIKLTNLVRNNAVENAKDQSDAANHPD